jgi:DNA-binding LacI/PurR family transcriptional regulator
MIAPQDEAADALLHTPADIPLVAVQAGPVGTVPVVAVDQFAGAAAATRYLLDLGHETVWHIAGPPNWVESRLRLDGWRATLEQAGAPAPAALPSDWSARGGYELGRSLSADPAVTAIFVANDQMALGALRAMHEAGREVPREVSVVGFDDIPEAPYFTPPLTTVRQDFNELGARGVRLLLRIMESGERVAPVDDVGADLVVRASTAVSRVRRESD